MQSAAVAALCKQLHVPCLDLDTGLSDADIRALRGPDDVHFNEAGHHDYGTRAGEALAALLPAEVR
ncbi:MAG: SGNH/GDSL hydrolase family protein [Tepidiformaceae bacterium]